MAKVYVIIKYGIDEDDLEIVTRDVLAVTTTTELANEFIANYNEFEGKICSDETRYEMIETGERFIRDVHVIDGRRHDDWNYVLFWTETELIMDLK